MDSRRRSPARLLAPIALVAFMLALFAVVVGSNSPEGADSADAGGQSSEQLGETGDDGDEEGDDATVPTQRFYTVQTGDTLAAIAEEVGVEVDTLLQLNPELDPQALVSGQRIRLRE